MGEVEEDLEEDHDMSVIEGEEDGVMFASSGVGGDQNIMKRFGVIGRV